MQLGKLQKRREITIEHVDWSYLAQGWVQLRDAVNTLM